MEKRGKAARVIYAERRRTGKAGGVTDRNSKQEAETAMHARLAS
jgi:hypothetical protein